MYPRIHFWIFMPFPVLASSVKFSSPARLETQKSRYTREPSGSRMCLPEIFKVENCAAEYLEPVPGPYIVSKYAWQRQKDDGDGIYKTGFFSAPAVSSIPQEIIFSNTARMVEKAANDIKMKNRLPTVFQAECG